MADVEIRPDQLDEAVRDILVAYDADVMRGVKAAAKDAAKKCYDEIKAHVTFNERTGGYVKAMDTKKTEDTPTSIEYVWYVKAPHHRLAHLLENGHASRSGGRVKAYPHIVFGETVANAYFEKKVGEVIANA